MRPLSIYRINNVFDEIFDDFFKFTPWSLEYNPSKEFFPIEKLDEKFNKYFPSYPVTNNYIDEKGTSIIEIAIPGMDKEDIEIKVEGDKLSIQGKKKEEKSEKGIYVHRKLAKRDFTISFKCSSKQDLDKIDALIENGLLVISIPLKEESKPKIRQITIK